MERKNVQKEFLKRLAEENTTSRLEFIASAIVFTVTVLLFTVILFMI